MKLKNLICLNKNILALYCIVFIMSEIIFNIIDLKVGFFSVSYFVLIFVNVFIGRLSMIRRGCGNEYIG